VVGQRTGRRLHRLCGRDQQRLTDGGGASQQCLFGGGSQLSPTAQGDDLLGWYALLERALGLAAQRVTAAVALPAPSYVRRANKPKARASSTATAMRQVTALAGCPTDGNTATDRFGSP
jgi:hypothetical protein